MATMLSFTSGKAKIKVQIPRPSVKRLRELGVKLIAHRPPNGELVYSIFKDALVENKTAKTAYWIVERIG